MMGLKSEFNSDEQERDKRAKPPASLPTGCTERAKHKFCTFKLQAPPVVLRKPGSDSTWHLHHLVYVHPRQCPTTTFSRVLVQRPAKLLQSNNNEYIVLDSNELGCRRTGLSDGLHVQYACPLSVFLSMIY